MIHVSIDELLHSPLQEGMREKERQQMRGMRMSLILVRRSMYEAHMKGRCEVAVIELVQITWPRCCRFERWQDPSLGLGKRVVAGVKAGGLQHSY